MLVERRAETVDEAHRPQSCPFSAARGMIAQSLLDNAQKNVQNRRHAPAILAQKVPQALGQRQNPLAHRKRRKHMIDQECSRLRHTPGVTGGADAAPLAEGDQEIVAAFGTARPSEPVGEDSAFQVPAEILLDVDRNRTIVPSLARQTRVGLEVFLDYPIQGRLGRLPGAVGDSGTSQSWLDSHVACQAGEWKNADNWIYIQYNMILLDCGHWLPNVCRIGRGYRNAKGGRGRLCGVVQDSARQIRAPHQPLIHRPGALPALADGPRHQGLAAAHVAGGEHALHGGVVRLRALGAGPGRCRWERSTLSRRPW